MTGLNPLGDMRSQGPWRPPQIQLMLEEVIFPGSDHHWGGPWSEVHWMFGVSRRVHRSGAPKKAISAWVQCKIPFPPRLLSSWQKPKYWLHKATRSGAAYLCLSLELRNVCTLEVHLMDAWSHSDTIISLIIAFTPHFLLHYLSEITSL